MPTATDTSSFLRRRLPWLIAAGVAVVALVVVIGIVALSGGNSDPTADYAIDDLGSSAPEIAWTYNPVPASVQDDVSVSLVANSSGNALVIANSYTEDFESTLYLIGADGGERWSATVADLTGATGDIVARTYSGASSEYFAVVVGGGDVTPGVIILDDQGRVVSSLTAPAGADFWGAYLFDDVVIVRSMDDASSDAEALFTAYRSGDLTSPLWEQEVQSGEDLNVCEFSDGLVAIGYAGYSTGWGVYPPCTVWSPGIIVDMETGEEPAFADFPNANADRRTAYMAVDEDVLRVDTSSEYTEAMLQDREGNDLWEDPLDLSEGVTTFGGYIFTLDSLDTTFTLEGINPATGERAWTTPVDGISTLFGMNGGNLIALTDRGRVIWIDPETGETRMETRTPISSGFLIGQSSSTTYVFADGALYAYGTNGEALWDIALDGRPAAIGGKLYVYGHDSSISLLAPP